MKLKKLQNQKKTNRPHLQEHSKWTTITKSKEENKDETNEESDGERAQKSQQGNKGLEMTTTDDPINETDFLGRNGWHKAAEKGKIFIKVLTMQGSRFPLWDSKGHKKWEKVLCKFQLPLGFVIEIDCLLINWTSEKRFHQTSNNLSNKWKKGSLHLRMIQASVNRGSRLGPKTSVQGKPWDTKILQVFFNIRGKILVFSIKMLNSLSFLLLLCVSAYSIDLYRKEFHTQNALNYDI